MCSCAQLQGPYAKVSEEEGSRIGAKGGLPHRIAGSLSASPSESDENTGVEQVSAQGEDCRTTGPADQARKTVDWETSHGSGAPADR